MPKRRRRSKLARKYRKNPDFESKVKGRAKRRRGLGERIDGRRGAKASIRKRRRPRMPHVARRLTGNPAFDVDWVETGKLIGVGFAGFAAGRFITRVVAVQVAKRKPSWAKHIGVAANLAAFLAAVFGAKRWSKTKPYEMPLIFGTGLALAQTIVQTYIPKLGWMVADATPEQLAEASGQIAAPQSQGLLADDDEEDDDIDDTYSYNDAYDHGRHARAAQPRPQQPHQPQTAPAMQPAAQPGDVDDMLAELDDNEDVFAN
jgi:hypothetical protein